MRFCDQPHSLVLLFKLLTCDVFGFGFSVLVFVRILLRAVLCAC